MTIESVSMKIISTVSDSKIACDFLSREDVIFIDCEGANLGSWDKGDSISLIQIATLSGRVFLFGFNRFMERDQVIAGGLRTILESEKIVKVFFAFRSDIVQLAAEGIAVPASSVRDLQLLDRIVSKSKNLVGLDKVMTKYDIDSFDNGLKASVSRYFRSGTDVFATRPLGPELVRYAAADVENLPRLAKKMLKLNTLEEVREYLIKGSTELAQCSMKDVDHARGGPGGLLHKDILIQRRVEKEMRYPRNHW